MCVPKHTVQSAHLPCLLQKSRLLSQGLFLSSMKIYESHRQRSATPSVTLSHPLIPSTSFPVRSVSPSWSRGTGQALSVCRTHFSTHRRVFMCVSPPHIEKNRSKSSGKIGLEVSDWKKHEQMDERSTEEAREVLWKHQGALVKRCLCTHCLP